MLAGPRGYKNVAEVKQKIVKGCSVSLGQSDASVIVLFVIFDGIII